MLTRPNISIYITFIPTRDLIYKFCAVLVYVDKNNNIHEKFIHMGYRHSSTPRIKLISIREALKSIKQPANIDIYLTNENIVKKYQYTYVTKNISYFKSTKDLWIEILKLTKEHNINFKLVETNDNFIKRCNDKLLDSNDCIIENDKYEFKAKEKNIMLEKLFKSACKQQNITKLLNLSFLECVILAFVRNYDKIYTEYTISQILSGSTSEYLSAKIKLSFFYGIFNRLYSRKEIRECIYCLIHNKHYLIEQEKKCSDSCIQDKYITVGISSKFIPEIYQELEILEKQFISTL